MTALEKIHIIGVGDDGFEGLSERATQWVQSADLLVGSAQTLAAVPGGKAERIEASNDLDQLVELVASRPAQRIVLLTTGDPMFYGVARYLCDRLGKDRFEVVPHVSAMQLAFARVKENWDEAYLANLATISLDRVVEKTRSAEKVGLFTTDAIPPARVASALLNRQIDYFTVYVCENLGSPDERVTQGELGEIGKHEFSPLNVMILVRKPDVPDRPREMAGRRLFGNPDEMFLQSKPKRGLLTSAEVRAIALSLLDLGSRSIVWDVGAGSGSVSIEAAQIAAEGTVYAIEMDADDHQLIVENAERFAATNVVPRLGIAPDAWADLPDPDAIFIGGTGRGVARMTELAFQRLRSGGRIVINVGSIHNLTAVYDVLRSATTDVNVRQVLISQAVEQLEAVRFEAMNPTFLISAVKVEN
ncbi:MAG: precorrin-6y C5,15-methyltransferase (decarboxylating) subunit CbiE [Pirellulaceae bacterium]